MGFRTDTGPPGKRPGHTLALDESGQLSIDFYIGLSIFLVALIIAATMISGLLVGLQGKTIDYDAVAYRTGVILVEDPGEPTTQFNYATITETDQWEFIGVDQKEQVRRFGLTLYKSTPRILSEQKIDSFFDSTMYPSLSDYRERIIFGSYPYRFNISLSDMDEKPLYSAGNPYDADSSYGYIRRVVLVKNQSRAAVDMYNHGNNTDPGTDGIFKVELNNQELMGFDRPPQYRIEPPKEDITINLTNISAIGKESQTPKLKAIRIEYYSGDYTGGLSIDDLSLDVPVFIDGIEKDPYVGDVDSDINITFPAGVFIPLSAIANVNIMKMNVVYEFDPDTVNLSREYNTYFYDDRSLDEGFSPPYLNPAVLEVRVW